MSYIFEIGKCTMTFSLESDNGLYVIKTYLFHDLNFVYVLEACTTLN